MLLEWTTLFILGGSSDGTDRLMLRRDRFMDLLLVCICTSEQRSVGRMGSTIFELTAKKARMMSDISVINNDSSGGGSLGRSTDLSSTQAGR